MFCTSLNDAVKNGALKTCQLTKPFKCLRLAATQGELEKQDNRYYTRNIIMNKFTLCTAEKQISKHN